MIQALITCLCQLSFSQKAHHMPRAVLVAENCPKDPLGYVSCRCVHYSWRLRAISFCHTWAHMGCLSNVCVTRCDWCGLRGHRPLKKQLSHQERRVLGVRMYLLLPQCHIFLSCHVICSEDTLDSHPLPSLGMSLRIGVRLKRGWPCCLAGYLVSDKSQMFLPKIIRITVVSSWCHCSHWGCLKDRLVILPQNWWKCHRVPGVERLCWPTEDVNVNLGENGFCGTKRQVLGLDLLCLSSPLSLKTRRFDTYKNMYVTFM